MRHYGATSPRGAPWTEECLDLGITIACKLYAADSSKGIVRIWAVAQDGTGRAWFISVSVHQPLSGPKIRSFASGHGHYKVIWEQEIMLEARLKDEWEEGEKPDFGDE